MGTEGPIILWQNYGAYEGWAPKSYPTIKDALADERYTSEFVITKLIDYEVTETK